MKLRSEFQVIKFQGGRKADASALDGEQIQPNPTKSKRIKVSQGCFLYDRLARQAGQCRRKLEPIHVLGHGSWGAGAVRARLAGATTPCLPVDSGYFRRFRRFPALLEKIILTRKGTNHTKRAMKARKLNRIKANQTPYEFAIPDLRFTGKRRERWLRAIRIVSCDPRSCGSQTRAPSAFAKGTGVLPPGATGEAGENPSKSDRIQVNPTKSNLNL